MATIASAKDRECDIFLDSGDCSKEGQRVANELLYSRAIGVNEGDGDGRVTFVGWDGRREPSGWVDEGKSFADWVAFELIDEGRGGCGSPFGVPLDRNAVDDDFGEAVLWDEAGTGAEWRGEDGAVSVDHVVGWFASEG